MAGATTPEIEIEEAKRLVAEMYGDTNPNAFLFRVANTEFHRAQQDDGYLITVTSGATTREYKASEGHGWLPHFHRDLRAGWHLPIMGGDAARRWGMPSSHRRAFMSGR